MYKIEVLFVRYIRFGSAKVDDRIRFEFGSFGVK